MPSATQAWEEDARLNAGVEGWTPGRTRVWGELTPVNAGRVGHGCPVKKAGVGGIGNAGQKHFLAWGVGDHAVRVEINAVWPWEPHAGQVWGENASSQRRSYA